MFRETFLAHLREEEDLRALRHFGRMLYAWVLEFSHYDPDARESLVRVALRAAAADLRHLAGYLADATLEPSPEWPEAALVRQARRWARQVGELAHHMEEEVEAPRQAVIPGLGAPAPGSGSGAEPPDGPDAPGREDGPTAESHALLYARISLQADVYILQQLISRLQAVRESLPLPPEPAQSRALEEGNLDAYPALALAGDLDSFVDHLSQQAREMQSAAGLPGRGPAGHPIGDEDPTGGEGP